MIKIFNPKTHSDILWHFTGGPSWNVRSQRQNKKLKSNNDAFNTLVSILISKELRVGNYHEIIRCMVPEETIFDNKSGKFVLKKNSEKLISTVPVCCVADIPQSELSHHAERYGKFAIGFKRSSLVKAGFNPVFYTLDDREIILNYYKAQSSLEFTDNGAPSVIEELGDQISQIEHEDIYDIDISEAISVVTEMESNSEEALHRLKKAMAFIKTFNTKEFDTIYSEREWRSVNSLKFNWSDVDTIILRQESGYFDKFTSTNKKKLKIPRSIRILRWDEIFWN